MLKHVSEDFGKLNLDINYDKCELISKDDDQIHTPINTIIESKPFAKYLGQEIDHEGNPTANIQNKVFSKLITLLEKNAGLAIVTKIKTFKVYIQSRITHLIPLFVVSNRTEQLWTTLRKILFKYILNRCTLPKESAGNFKCGFFDIILKPILRLCESISETTSDVNYISFLRSACAKAALTMVTIETNHNQQVNQAVVAVNSGEYIELKTWTCLIERSIGSRLWLDNWNERAKEALRKIRQPNIIFMLSNAPFHILEEILPKIQKLRAQKDEEKAQPLILRATAIIAKYMIANQYVNQYQTGIITGVPNLCAETTTEILEQHTLLSLSLRLFLDIAQAKILTEVSYGINTILETVNSEACLEKASTLIRPHIILFRDLMLQRCRIYDKEVELLLDLAGKEINNPLKHTSDEKTRIDEPRTKPGRPRKEPDNYPKIDQFLTKKL